MRRAACGTAVAPPGRLQPVVLLARPVLNMPRVGVRIFHSRRVRGVPGRAAVTVTTKLLLSSTLYDMCGCIESQQEPDVRRASAEASSEGCTIHKPHGPQSLAAPHAKSLQLYHLSDVLDEQLLNSLPSPPLKTQPPCASPSAPLPAPPTPASTPGELPCQWGSIADNQGTGVHRPPLLPDPL